MDMSSSTSIRRSLEDVFAYVSDVSNDVNWRSGVTESGLRSDSPVTTGSIGYAGNGKLETVYITTFEPERVDWEFIEGPFVGFGGYRLEREHTGTRFTLVADVRPSGAMRLLGPVFGMVGRRQNRADVETLKRTLESEQAPLTD